MKTSEIVGNLVKNSLAPVVLPLIRARGSLGMDGDSRAVAATLGQLLSALEQVPVSLAGADVIELGTGRTPELALAFSACGARSVRGFDVLIQVPTDWPSRVTAGREIAAAVADHSNDVGTDEELVKCVSFTRFDGHQLPLADQSIDLIFSKSVLEHVSPTQVEPLVREMYRVLRKGGAGVHAIDLRDHMHIDGEKVRGDWLDALRYPEPLFRAMFSNRSTSINRLRAHEWSHVFASAGFQLVHMEPRRYPLAPGFERARLLKRWRNLPEEELAIGQILMVVAT